MLCPITPLDRSANAERARRPRAPTALDLSPLPPAGMVPLLSQLLADYSATGLPPAYLPAPTSPAEQNLA